MSPIEDREMDAAVRTWAVERGKALSAHPSPDELIDYQLGVLPVADQDRVQEHLTFCAQCAAVVLDLAAIADPSGREPVVSRDVAEREWLSLQARLESEREATSATLRTWLPWAFAAASLLLSVGFMFWALSLDRRLAETRRPQADIVVFDLAPNEEGPVRGPEAPVTRVPVPPYARRVVLVLHLGDVPSFTTYRMELRTRPGGEVVWSDLDVRRAEGGAFSLDLPVEVVRPGGYEIRILGERQEGSSTLADYAFEVVRGESR